MNEEAQRRLDASRKETRKWKKECFERGKDLVELSKIIEDCKDLIDPAVLSKMRQILFKQE